MVTTRTLSRQQIARIVGDDQEAIRAFEALVATGQTVTIATFNALVSRVSSLEGRVDGSDVAVAALEADIIAINTTLADYGVRIGDLETEVDGLLAREGISAIRTVTTTAAATSADDVILADAAAGGFTISLPAADTMTGRRLEIKKIDSTSNAVTVDPDGVETIDGSTTMTIDIQNTARTVISDGTAWWII